MMKRITSIIIVMIMMITCFMPAAASAGQLDGKKSFEIYGVKKVYQYKGVTVEPKITVKDGDKVLTEGVHYVVEYDELKEMYSSTKVTAIGIGEYKGVTAYKSYEVVSKYGRHIAETRILNTPVYTGKPIIPKVEILGNLTYAEGIYLTQPYPLKEGSDYTVTATNNINAGSQARCIVKGNGYFLGMDIMSKPFTIAKRNVKNLKVTGVTDKVYTSKVIKQNQLDMYLGKEKMIKGKEYTVSYKNNLKCGKATITIKGIGRNFTGKKTVTFNIYPRKVKNVKLTAGDNSVTVKYNKNYGEVTGYQTRYSVNKNFNGYKAKNTKDTSVKISKLGDKKNYYVKVRAYKVIDGKKVFGNWSDVKKIKTR